MYGDFFTQALPNLVGRKYAIILANYYPQFAIPNQICRHLGHIALLITKSITKLCPQGTMHSISSSRTKDLGTSNYVTWVQKWQLVGLCKINAKSTRKFSLTLARSIAQLLVIEANWCNRNTDIKHFRIKRQGLDDSAARARCDEAVRLDAGALASAEARAIGGNDAPGARDASARLLRGGQRLRDEGPSRLRTG